MKNQELVVLIFCFSELILRANVKLEIAAQLEEKIRIKKNIIFVNQ